MEEKKLIISENVFLLYDLVLLYRTNKHYDLFSFQSIKDQDRLIEILSPSLWNEYKGLVVDISLSSVEGFELMERLIKSKIITRPLLLVSYELPVNRDFFHLNTQVILYPNYNKKIVEEVLQEDPYKSSQRTTKILSFLKSNKVGLFILKRLLIALQWDLSKVFIGKEKEDHTFMQLVRSRSFSVRYGSRPYKILQGEVLENIVFELGELPGMKEYFLLS